MTNPPPGSPAASSSSDTSHNPAPDPQPGGEPKKPLGERLVQFASNPPRPPEVLPLDDTIKGTFESIVIAFILAFVFRAYVVEAFVIPTGSMAPTLMGKHLRVTCAQDGYTFTVGPPPYVANMANRNHVTVPTRQEWAAVCPMDNYPNVIPVGTYMKSGDRILVEKFIYDFTSPKRWDVIVFKFPGTNDGGPRTNFIKRLVGLPGESLYIFDGNLYVKEKGSKTWLIARKPDRPAVQNAVWQPIYSSQYIPRDHGYDRRNPTFAWSPPWVPAAGQAGQWEIANRRSYHYDSSLPGQINFSFHRSGDEGGRTLYAYDEFRPQGNEPIEDIRLTAAFTPDKPGLDVKMTTTARLDNIHLPPQPITAEISGDGTVSLTTTNPITHKTRVLVPPVPGYRFPAGETTHVQFWFVDQQASVWINGDKVLTWNFEIPMDQLVHRRQPNMRPDISIAVAGSPVTLHKVDLSRDLYYTTYGGPGPARGGLMRGNGGAHGAPVVLGPNEYFVLGDNSPVSDDGRYWSHVNPWIQKQDFDGKSRPGIVPGRLIVGKAFFVYLPAPFSIFGHRFNYLPDFGDMRFIH